MYYNVKPVLFSMNPCTNILDNMSNKIDTVHFYIDLKNSSTMLFIEDYLKEILYNTQKNPHIDTSIFQSIFFTIYQWKTFFNNKNLKYKIFICNESGESKYHTGIYKDYKKNRKIRKSTFLAELSQEVNNIKQQNWNISKIVTQTCDNVYFLELDRIESDFIPYYLITRNYKDMDNIYHVISSTDKDHYQILNIPNTIMFSKKSNEFTIYDKNSYLAKYVKPAKNTTNINKQAQYIELMSRFNSDYINVLMAFCGDASDSIPGLPKIGEKTAIKMLTNDEVTSVLLGSLDEIEDRVNSGGQLLNMCKKDYYDKLDPNWQLAYNKNDLITNSYRMISYESLCRYLEKLNTELKRVNIDILSKFEENNTLNTLQNKESTKKHILGMADCNFDLPLIEYTLQ